MTPQEKESEYREKCSLCSTRDEWVNYQDEMICGVCGNTHRLEGTTWECTTELRWLGTTLQQKLISNTGEVNWREIPTVKQ